MSPEALAAVREFMTDGIDSPLYGSDPLAARRGAEACAAYSPAPRPRSARRPSAPPETFRTSSPPPREAGGAPSAARFYDAGMTELWGAETRKAIDNFPVSGRPIPAGVVHWLGRIKAAAARVNADLGLLDAELAQRIAAAGDADRRGRARRPVPDRRLPDRLGHVVEHERERGHGRARRRGRPSQRPRQSRPVVQRRLPVRGAPGRAGRRDQRAAAGARRARGGARGQGRGVRRRSSRRAARTSWTPCP